jgi:p-aminobenzoyl-glutamate transporter AbgT
MRCSDAKPSIRPQKAVVGCTSPFLFHGSRRLQQTSSSIPIAFFSVTIGNVRKVFLPVTRDTDFLQPIIRHYTSQLCTHVLTVVCMSVCLKQILPRLAWSKVQSTKLFPSYRVSVTPQSRDKSDKCKKLSLFYRSSALQIIYILMQKSVTSVNANIPLHSTGVVSFQVDNDY